MIKLLINAEEPEECRIAQVENGRLDSYHVTTVVRERTKNNIYKGRIVAVEANLQAAFVEIGTDRNGFLPFNEIHPEYFREDVGERDRKLISQHQWKKLKIEDVVKKGQEVLVQVVKEVTGNKGANMTTYLSLPGRCLVLMPGSDSAGISRKIVGEERRSALREIMSNFSIPEGIGYIIRTASADITKTALQKDLRYLLRLWKEIKKRGQTMNAPALIYEEQDTVVRFLRDHFVPEISEIQVDTEESLEQVNQFVELLPAKQKKVRVKLHRGAKPIFNQNNIEEQIESIYKPQVPLPSGGSIVIDPTEALVAIDVNSGRTSKNGDFEETIFQANMEAAVELARQLRLRDLGGLIVVDFIDMRNKKHIREVEKQVKASMKRDKAKVDISRISRFGLMQISRQKMGAPIEKGSYLTCEHCQGRGVVKSVETQALYYLRRIQTGILRKKIQRVECRLPLDVANYLLNKKRKELGDLEARHHASIDIIPRPEMKPGDNRIEFLQAH
ncbi:MAG TPA: Rne/Rng family ribonuclease [Desulfobulbus sp.]|nr:Rne/Rng family ribonuclease [Desulfobulbus sp.]